MRVKGCLYSDVGRKCKVNQDASLVKVANTRNYGRISFVAVCDGNGEKARGEVASCKAIRSLENWFHEELPLMISLSEERLWDTIEKSLRRLIVSIQNDITRYAKHRHVQVGTTITALIQIGKRYLFLNQGNSRIYFTQRGDMELVPGYDQTGEGLLITRGEFTRNTTVVACNESFAEGLSGSDIYSKLCPQMCVSSRDMMRECKKLVMLASKRKEDDDYSVAALSLEF